MSDEAATYAALVTGSLALIGTVYSTITNHLSKLDQDRFKFATDQVLADLKTKTDVELKRLDAELVAQRDERIARAEATKVLVKFRDPLLHAAYDLQSRLFNILKLTFLPRYFVSGSAREKEYAIENTTFLLAQFLGWTELLRQEIQFLDVGTDDQTRRLRSLQDKLYSLLQTDTLGKGFRLFAGEQRAVGELMIDKTGASPRCLGFAAFLKTRNPDIDRWLDPIREDVKQMSQNIEPFRGRLTGLQHSLVDFLSFLDPDFKWFPQTSRTKT